MNLSGYKVFFFKNPELLYLPGFLFQNHCPGVAESAAIGYAHDIKGQGEEGTGIWHII